MGSGPQASSLLLSGLQGSRVKINKGVERDTKAHVSSKKPLNINPQRKPIIERPRSIFEDLEGPRGA